MAGNNDRILDLARRLRGVIDGAVVGGIAVYLHGVARATTDLDFYVRDRKVAAVELEEAGAKWDKEEREHVMEGVPIHTITAGEAGVEVERTSVIDGVRVVTLKDLVAIKLISGLKNRGRSKDLGDVEELIRAVPLDKRFAGKLPAAVRAEFKKMVDGVRAGQRGRRY